MSISAEDRRHLLERLEQVTDERAARTMSEYFDDHDEVDPSITARFDQVDATLRDHTAKFDQIDTTLREHGTRFDQIDATLHEHSAKFDQIDTTLHEHSTRFDQIDRRFETLELHLDHRFDRMALELTGVFRTEIAAAITSQTRTVIFGMLASAASLSAMAIGLGQVL